MRRWRRSAHVCDLTKWRPTGSLHVRSFFSLLFCFAGRERGFLACSLLRAVLCSSTQLAMLLQPPHPLTLVWITFRADQLTCWFWKETWRLCRGWVTRIGLIPSTSWLSVCFFFSSFKIPAWLWDLWMFDFFPIHFQVCTPSPLFHWMLHTHQFFFPSTSPSPKCDLTVEYQVSKSMACSRPWTEIHILWKGRGDAVDITNGWVSAPEVE